MDHEHEDKLKIAIYILSLLSTYTTLLGIADIWEQVSFLERYTFALLFSVAISIIMIYLIFQITKTKTQGLLIAFSISYILIALISFFFNFYAFVNYMNKNTILSDEVKKIRNISNELVIYIEKILDKNFEINKLQTRVDKLTADALSEVTNNLNPGPGPKHQKIKEKLNFSKEKLKTANNKKSQILSKVQKHKDSISKEAFDALKANQKNKYLEKLIRIQNDYSQLLSIAKQFSINNDLSKNNALNKFNVCFSQIERGRTPSDNVKSIVDLFFDREKIPEWQRYSIYLSLFLAFILDFPIFFSIVVFSTVNVSQKHDNTITKDLALTKATVTLKKPDDSSSFINFDDDV